MSWWSRLANVFRADRVHRELAEELQSQLDEAMAHGREPAEARRGWFDTMKIRVIAGRHFRPGGMAGGAASPRGIAFRG